MSGLPTKPAESGPVIRISVADTMPAGMEDGLGILGVPVEVARRPSGPFAGIEAHLPTAAALFVAAGYFNGFLSKLGEDHYGAVKAVARRLLSRARRAGACTVAISGAAQVRYSPAFSIVAELPSGTRCKLVLATGLSDDHCAMAVDAFLDLVRSAHGGQLGEQDRLLLARPPVWGVTVLTFDPGGERIVPAPDGRTP